MSKRTTSTNKPADSPVSRRRAARPAAEAVAAEPKTPKTRRKTVAPTDVVAADDRIGAVATTGIRRQPSHDEIATRAYFIALEHGFQSDPFVTWLIAERELAG